jgi:hypothetical protein
MLDFSFAAGLEPTWSSFSRMVFSVATILRVAMMVRLLYLCTRDKC